MDKLTLKRGGQVLAPSLFTVGNFLYGRVGLALLLSGVFVVSGLVLLYTINQLWSYNPVGAGVASANANPVKDTK